MFQWGELEKVMAVVSQLLPRVKEVGFDAEGKGRDSLQDLSSSLVCNRTMSQNSPSFQKRI